MSESDHSPMIPQHVAVVMDGNGRWAKKRFLPRTAGHRAGVSATQAIVENCAKRGIKALTVFAFSSENWNRPKKEVDALMSIFISTLKGEMEKLNKQNVRVSFIGDRTEFIDELQAVINETEQVTSKNTGLALTIAANYGGRWDVAEACKRIAKKVSSGELSVDEIDEFVLDKEGHQIKGIGRHHTDGSIYEVGRKFMLSKKPGSAPEGVIEVKVTGISIMRPGPCYYRR